METTYKGIKAYLPKSRADWRRWLSKNHENEKSVWLIHFHKGSGGGGISRQEALEEALCFGWIDSVANKRDEQSFYQFYSQRRPKSVWSKVNKKLISHLIKNKLMHPSGLKTIALAKKTGTWNALDEIDKLRIPDDLSVALKANPVAARHFKAFPPSSKKIILFWITSAKRVETRAQRIAQTVAKAEQNIRANHYVKKSGDI
jgi:uncharacterized protein YdeI (YjbR/CyaY-like superfamily)